MLRKLLGAGAVLAVVLAGCRGPKGACDTNEDCGQGQTCDATVNLCFVTETIDGKACSTTCSEFQACKDGSCTARFSGYAFLMPREGGAVKSGEVQLKVQLLPRTDINASPNYPASISFTVTPKSGGEAATGTLARDAEGFYTGTWTAPQGTASDAFDLEVRSDALADAGKTSFRLDNDAPVFTVSVATAQPGPNTAETTYVDPGLANAWRRDQVVTVAVAANEAVDASSVRLTVTGIGEGTQMAPLEVADTGTGCGQAFCGQVDVDLSQPPMKAFRGNFDLKAAGHDAAGNAGTGTKSINVTRWKWMHKAITKGLVSAAPAIGNAGFVYLGSSSGSEGQFAAIHPNGTPAWPAVDGPVSSSPAVGELKAGVERVYVARKLGTISLAGYFTNLSRDFIGVCPPYDDGSTGGVATIESALAIAQSTAAGADIETVYGNYSGRSSGTLFAMRPSADPSCPTKGGVGNVAYPGNMVVLGNSVAFAVTVGSVKAWSLDSADDWGAEDWARTVPTSPTSLAVAGPQLVGGNNDGSASKVFSLPWDNSADAALVATASAAWNPTVGSDGTALVGLQNQALLRLPVGGGSATPLAVPSHVFKGAPVWGEDGVVYLASVTSSGIQARLGTSIAWDFKPSNGDLFEASMNLDCSRGAEGSILLGAPAVLYAASTSGNLYALVADSRGLDAEASWPRYQHDARNSGNPGTPITACK